MFLTGLGAIVHPVLLCSTRCVNWSELKGFCPIVMVFFVHLYQILNLNADAAHCHSEEPIHRGVQGFMGGEGLYQ